MATNLRIYLINRYFSGNCCMQQQGKIILSRFDDYFRIPFQFDTYFIFGSIFLVLKVCYIMNLIILKIESRIFIKNLKIVSIDMHSHGFLQNLKCLINSISRYQLLFVCLLPAISYDEFWIEILCLSVALERYFVTNKWLD